MDDGSFLIRAEDAADFVSSVLEGKPELVVARDMTVAVRAVRPVLADSGRMYSRGNQMVRLAPVASGMPEVEPLDHHMLTNEVHRLVQPVKLTGGANGKPIISESITLPERAAHLILAMPNDDLPPLHGVTTAPLLTSNGGVHAVAGYDVASGIWCANPPHLTLPAYPSRRQAEAGLMTLRAAFSSFPFADSQRIYLSGSSVSTVDTRQLPGADESGFLAGLMTAICRASLILTPGLKFAAPAISGAGSGKGMLARSIGAVAFGTHPSAITAGSEKSELDKRIGSAAMRADPMLFLDNLNGAVLKSDALASILTERTAMLRVLGKSELVALNCRAFIVVTGNGLTLAEDLARRFIACDLDAKTEDPEARPFDPGFLETVFARRAELLAAALTIWRWGRQNPDSLKRGKPLGSYETWAEWVRDPLLTLGCVDPVARIADAKAADPNRRRIAELYATWHEHHKNSSMKATELHEDCKAIADPHNRGRQFLATFLAQLTKTRTAGFVLTQARGAGRWSVATYALEATQEGQSATIPASVMVHDEPETFPF